MTDEVDYCVNGCTRNHNGQRNPVQVRPPSKVCTRCEDNLRRWLTEIVERYGMLPTFQAHGSVPRDPEAKAPRRVEAPAPMRLEIVDLLDTRRGRKWQGVAVTDDRRGPLGIVNAIANNIRAEKSLKGEPQPTMAGEVRLIERWLLWMCEQEWIEDVYIELRDLHRELGDAIGERRPKPVGQCRADTDEGECGGPLLPTAIGGVRCPRCGDSWDIDELRRLGLLLTEREPA